MDIRPQAVVTEDDLTALRARNEQRLAAAKEKLGSKWLLHPSKQVQRNPDADKPVLAQSGLLYG